MDPLIGLAMCDEFAKRLFRGPISVLIAFASWSREFSKP